MQITLKVTPAALEDPVGVVRKALEAARPDLATSADVEEVFPGLQTGNRAGMVVVRLAKDISKEDLDTLVAALRACADVMYAEPAHPRKSR